MTIVLDVADEDILLEIATWLMQGKVHAIYQPPERQGGYDKNHDVVGLVRRVGAS